jgi:hypothetical protein
MASNGTAKNCPLAQRPLAPIDCNGGYLGAVARCGAAALLIKPFASRKLLETLATILGPDAERVS